MRFFDRLISMLPGTNAGLHREVMDLAARMKKNRNILVELNRQTDSLTKKDIASWHQAWQAAISVDSPSRTRLYDIYTDALVDLHLAGCIAQRKGKTLQKPFVLTGREDGKARLVFEREWFADFIDLALDSIFWGHSLIQFDGITYRDGDIADWCIEVGKPRDLGLLLKCAPQSLSKKNMLAYWDMFGEVFGMPIRVGKTMSQDPKDIARIEDMLSKMEPLAWGLFPEGTEIEIRETSRGDAFNVYDKRVDRYNSEISKGILGQTMTIDNGSSLSQSETHLEIFENICRADAIMIRYIVNDRLIPLMLRHGLSVNGVSFDWDEAVTYTPAEQREIERLLLGEYDIDPAYFADKYKIPITGKKKNALPDDFFG